MELIGTTVSRVCCIFFSCLPHPSSITAARSPIESVEQPFRRLEAQWKADTLVLSAPGKIMCHPAMRAIIAMGEDVVPLMLRDLQDGPSVSVWALPETTGENLAPPRTEGSFLTSGNSRHATS
jgi:hypothetical protein